MRLCHILHALNNQVTCISRLDNTRLESDSRQENNSSFRHFIQTGSMIHLSSYSVGRRGCQLSNKMVVMASWSLISVLYRG
jgi:hypothetical protein